VTQLWDVTDSGNPTMLHGHEGPVWDAVASRDGRKIASAGEDGTVRVWNADGTGEPIILHSHAGRVLGVAFSPDGKRVAGAGQGGTVRVWNADGTGDPVVLSGARVLRAANNNDAVWGVTFTRDGHHVVGANLSQLYSWTAARSNYQANGVAGPGIPGPLAKFVYNPMPPLPAGQWTIPITNGIVRVFRMAGLDDPDSSRQHGRLAFYEALSTDGRLMATRGDQVGTVQLWNSDGTRSPVTLQAHQGQVRSVALSHDGQRVATTGDDATVRIWRSSGQGEPLIFRGLGTSVENVNFTPDGRLITTYDDGTIRIWRCEVCGPIQKVIALAHQRVP